MILSKGYDHCRSTCAQAMAVKEEAERLRNEPRSPTWGPAGVPRASPRERAADLNDISGNMILRTFLHVSSLSTNREGIEDWYILFNHDYFFSKIVLPFLASLFAPSRGRYVSKAANSTASKGSLTIFECQSLLTRLEPSWL